MNDSLVILLHGVGSNGADLAGLGDFWHDSFLPDTAFASPNAPQRFPYQHSDGWQWFSLEGVTPENRPARLEAARADFDVLLNRIIHAHQMQDQLHRVVLVGFSQGSMMALDALASGRWPVGGVVAFSGRLSTRDPLQAANTPVLLIHGQQDEVIPWRESESADARLRAAGYHVEAHYEPATAHTISIEGVQQAGAWIAEVLGVDEQD